MKLQFSTSVIRKLSKLKKTDPTLRKRVDKTLLQLMTNYRHPSLRLHKIDTINYSISVDMSYRIIFSWKGDIILLTDFGKHEEVYS